MSGRNLVRVKRYVAGYLFHDGKVLLIRKAKPEWQAGRWNGIGGSVEPDELFWPAMVREFREETGLTVLDWKHFATLTGDDRNDNRGAGEFIVEFFCAQVPSDQLNHPEVRDEGKGEILEWHPVNYLPEQVLPNLRWLIPMAYFAHESDWPLLVVERKGDGQNVSVYGRDFLPGGG